MPYCTKLMNAIDQKFSGENAPNSKQKFKYTLFRDTNITQRFDVSIYKSHEDQKAKTNSILLHSKDKTGTFPIEGEYNGFSQKLKEALHQLNIDAELPTCVRV